jgi:solute carrier family 35 protein F1/2
MIIEDFSIPSAVILSIVFLKVSYLKIHWIGIFICVCGISLGFLNDFLFFEQTSEASKPLLGDLLALVGAFLYALENVLQEYLLKKNEDIFNFLGFIGLFGVLITLAEATFVWEFSQFNNIAPGDGWKVFLNFFGMAAINFVTYTIIPFYVTRSGATLLNLSNVTTIIWSMLSDILLY